MGFSFLIISHWFVWPWKIVLFVSIQLFLFSLSSKRTRQIETRRFLFFYAIGQRMYPSLLPNLFCHCCCIHVSELLLLRASWDSSWISLLFLQLCSFLFVLCLHLLNTGFFPSLVYKSHAMLLQNPSVMWRVSLTIIILLQVSLILNVEAVGTVSHYTLRSITY